MRWTGHEVRREAWPADLNRRYHLRDIDVDVSIILKWM
jgi:hypothetical protein